MILITSCDMTLISFLAMPEQIRLRDSHYKNALHYCAAQTVNVSRDLVAAASIAVAAPDLLESADEDGFTPLHLAVIQGNLAMVNLLLANKANVNAVDKEGHSVVHWATVCGEVDALRAVLAAGANVTTPDINGGTPLHYAAQMCGASYEGKLSPGSSSKLALEILDILLAHPQCNVEAEDRDGRPPLLWASSAGSEKAIIALINAGAKVECCDKDGLTALHCAASRGHTACIDALIGLCGASTDLIDTNGCTALHYSVTLGHADATARLLDLEADPNRQDRKGRTPSHCGCAKGQLETVKLLKDRGANLWLRNAKGDLPLHEAASSGRRELVEWLLEQRPKHANTTSNDGRTLLHIAAQHDYTDMCKLLLDYRGDVNAVYRNSKSVHITPLDCAMLKGHRSTAKFLQTHGGLPAGKLKLASRRTNPFKENSMENVRPMQYIEKEEIHDLSTSKKYVVYHKRSDSDGGEEGCSCTERTYHREQRYAHICQRHRKGHRRHLRRRTSSCGEPKENGKDSGDICRSKSNFELSRKKSKERYVSSSEWDAEDDEDSCENCCYHKHKKHRVVHKKRSTPSKRLKERRGTDEDEEGGGKEHTQQMGEQAQTDANTEANRKESKASTPTRPNSKSSSTKSRPASTAKQSMPATPAKEATFIKSTTVDAELAAQPKQGIAEENKQLQPADDLSEDDGNGLPENVVAVQAVVHHGADEISLNESENKAEDEERNKAEDKKETESHEEKADQIQTKGSQEEAKTSDHSQTEDNKEAENASGESIKKAIEKQISKEVEEVLLTAAGVVANGRTETKVSEEKPVESENAKMEQLNAETEIQSNKNEAEAKEKAESQKKTEAALVNSEDKSSTEITDSKTEPAKDSDNKEAANSIKTSDEAVAASTEEAVKETSSLAKEAESAKSTINVGEKTMALDIVDIMKDNIETKEHQQSTDTKTLPNTNEKPITPQATETSTENKPSQKDETKEKSQENRDSEQKPVSKEEDISQTTKDMARDKETRRSFTLLPSDSAEDDPDAESEEPERKSSFQILKSDESVFGMEDSQSARDDVELSDSTVFKVLPETDNQSKRPLPEGRTSPQKSAQKSYGKTATIEALDNDIDDDEDDDADDAADDPEADEDERNLRGFVESLQLGKDSSTQSLKLPYDYSTGRKRRLKKRVRSGNKSRSNWKRNDGDVSGERQQTSRDQDSGFEPSPRTTKTKIPTPRNVNTAHAPRRSAYTTLDGRSCSSRLENRKAGDKGACDMTAVTRSIQRNIRRYYMERKIFQHLLELKSLQIRSNKLNEAVLVKRAVDDYHKSCASLGGETGTRLRRYNFSEYTFKNFELFLYETLKALQKPGTYNFQNINEVYEEAERRLSPDYNAYEKALQCTTKTHRCLHAAHAYTGIPCAAYIPMMNHHTMPKCGFGSYKKTGVGSFYLPKILTTGTGCSGKVALELSHGKNKQLISLPSDKLDSNKRYYVTFTVKQTGKTNAEQCDEKGNAAGGGGAGACAGGSAA